jgi:hypothetical protein
MNGREQRVIADSVPPTQEDAELSHVVDAKIFRRLDQGPEGRAERPSVLDWLLIVEARSLRSALSLPRAKSRGAPVEVTGIGTGDGLPRETA